jgi:hypothetical protein
MSPSGMLRRVALIRIEISEEPSTSIIMVIRIGELGTSLAKFLLNVILTRATRRDIPEDGVLHSHRRGNYKSYILNKNSMYPSQICQFQGSNAQVLWSLNKFHLNDGCRIYRFPVSIELFQYPQLRR